MKRVSLLLMLFACIVLLLTQLATLSTYAQGGKDSDGDGVEDSVDKCPETPGPKENAGCPWPDSDGDGLTDDADKCPFEKGPKENAGCPLPPEPPPQPGPAPQPQPGDRDGDGVMDEQDGCADQAGPAENGGCPVSQDAAPPDPAANQFPLPALPETGPCMVATQGYDGVNIRQFPDQEKAGIIAVLNPAEIYPVLARLVNGDEIWYRVADGWIASWVARQGGDCDQLVEIIVGPAAPDSFLEQLVFVPLLPASPDTELPIVQPQPCPGGTDAVFFAGAGMLNLDGFSLENRQWTSPDGDIEGCGFSLWDGAVQIGVSIGGDMVPIRCNAMGDPSSGEKPAGSAVVRQSSVDNGLVVQVSSSDSGRLDIEPGQSEGGGTLVVQVSSGDGGRLDIEPSSDDSGSVTIPDGTSNTTSINIEPGSDDSGSLTLSGEDTAGSLELCNTVGHTGGVNLPGDTAAAPIYMEYSEFTPAGMTDPFCGQNFLTFQFTPTMEHLFGMCGSGGCWFMPLVH